MIGLSKIWRSAGGNTLRSKANNLVDDLAKLALERRMTIVAVRQVILNNLYRRYEEGMHYGKIGDFCATQTAWIQKRQRANPALHLRK